jgi:glycosyltransferase involved in cell wall biosynthesis
LDEFNQLGIPDHYREHFFLDDPFGGECMNCMQAGLRLATKVIAVSAGYAWEITTDMGGWGLAPLLREFGDAKLTGVANGIDLDEWSPEKDTFLDTDGYVRYQPDPSGFDGKLECKRALQKQLGLPVRDDVPLLGFIGRLDHQKGVDLITDAAGWLMGQDVQLIMLGSGPPRGVQADHGQRDEPGPELGARRGEVRAEAHRGQVQLVKEKRGGGGTTKRASESFWNIGRFLRADAPLTRSEGKAAWHVMLFTHIFGEYDAVARAGPRDVASGRSAF